MMTYIYALLYTNVYTIYIHLKIKIAQIVFKYYSREIKMKTKTICQCRNYICNKINKK